MTMEALSNRSELRKELERERRRLRDRQRRQSMSLEEREKHLARRRRNYQLRRQRSENARSSPLGQSQETTISISGETQMPASYKSDPVSSASDVSAPSNGVLHVGSNQPQQRFNVDNKKSESLEIPAHKLPMLPGKLRLNRIKHLARVMNVRKDDETAASTLVNGNSTSDCPATKGLRLNRVKSLARALNPSVKESASQNHQSITQG